MFAAIATAIDLIAALLYAGLAVHQLRHWNRDPLNRPLAIGFVVVASWSLFLAFLKPHALAPQLAESGRNLAFLAFLYGAMQSGGGGPRHALKSVYAAVAAVVGLQIVIGGITPEYRGIPIVFEALARSCISGVT